MAHPYGSAILVHRTSDHTPQPAGGSALATTILDIVGTYRWHAPMVLQYTSTARWITASSQPGGGRPGGGDHLPSL